MTGDDSREVVAVYPRASSRTEGLCTKNMPPIRKYGVSVLRGACTNQWIDGYVGIASGAKGTMVGWDEYEVGDHECEHWNNEVWRVSRSEFYWVRCRLDNRSTAACL